MSFFQLISNSFSLHNAPLLFCIETIALLFKLYLLTILWRYYSTPQVYHRHIALLVVMLVSSLISNIYWILSTLHEMDIIFFSNATASFLARMLWATNISLHLSMALFIEYLLEKELNQKTPYRFLRLWTGAFVAAFFLIQAFFNPTIFSLWEVSAYQAVYFYVAIVGLHTILYTIQFKSKKAIPRLLENQVKIFVFGLITPHLLLKLGTANPFTFSLFYVITNYAFMSCSTAFFTYAMYFCARKLVGMRFLNVKDHVEINYNFNFVKDFKKTLNDLGHSSSLNELKHITQQFFDTAFEIPTEKIRLYIRDENGITEPQNDKQLIIEKFLNNPSAYQVLNEFLYESKIFIKDEIEFSGFYDEQPHYQAALTFLTSIHSDLFLPIYNKQKLVGYIVLEQNARPKRFYSSVERDEMTVFAAYLNSIINLLRNRNLDALMLQEKELKEELYNKHQEINQYKESIRSFIRTSQERTIGLIFYKNKKFLFGNPVAQDLSDCDPNVQRGHPFALAIKQLALNAQNYGTAQTTTYRDTAKKLIITAIPNKDINGIIITLHYPEVADTIKLQSDLLKDPSQWDYLLYLETTESGQLINQLIPGTGETLLNFKINLLKTALSKKAILLCMAEADLPPTVELLHSISLRKNLHTITLTEPERDASIAIKLFGLNPLFSSNQKYEALLELLHNNGTLYIANIHLLALETQEYLADFLQYGAFRTYKSDYKTVSSVRIICSSNHNLARLVEQKLFSPALYNELKKASLTMPTLQKLSPTEFNELIEGLTRQTITTKSLERVLSLSSKETSSLYEKVPQSLHELRKKIYTALISKTQKNNLEDALEFGPAHLSTDPELTHAITLGKEALKNQQTMEFLWKKFKSQTKIATLLGVNRSSVNRRCKKYHLIE